MVTACGDAGCAGLWLEPVGDAATTMAAANTNARLIEHLNAGSQGRKAD
jgi:hypothetical protein